MSAKGAIEIYFKDSASAQLQVLGKAVADTQSKLQGFSGLAKNAFVMTAMYKGITAITGAFQEATTEIIAFDKALYMLQGLDASKSMEAYSKAIIDVSRGTEYGIDKVADAYGTLLKMGDSAGEAGQRLGGMMKAATATGDDLNSMMETGSAVMKTFKISAGQTEAVMDRLITAVDKSPQSWSDFSEAIKFAAPNAAALGVSMDTVLSMLGTLGQAGIKGSLAGNSLKNMFLQFLQPTEEVAEAMKGFNYENKTFFDFLEHVGKKVNMQELLETVGLRAITGAAFLKTNREEYEKLQAELDKSAGTSEQRAELMRKSMDAQLKMIGHSFTEMTAHFLNSYKAINGKDLLETVVESLASFNRQLEANGPEVQAFAHVVNVAAEAVGFLVENATTLVGVLAANKLAKVVAGMVLQMNALKIASTGAAVATAEATAASVALSRSNAIVFGITAVTTAVLAMSDAYGKARRNIEASNAEMAKSTELGKETQLRALTAGLTSSKFDLESFNESDIRAVKGSSSDKLVREMAKAQVEQAKKVLRDVDKEMKAVGFDIKTLLPEASNFHEELKKGFGDATYWTVQGGYVAATDEAMNFLVALQAYKDSLAAIREEYVNPADNLTPFSGAKGADGAKGEKPKFKISESIAKQLVPDVGAEAGQLSTMVTYITSAYKKAWVEGLTLTEEVTADKIAETREKMKKELAEYSDDSWLALIKETTKSMETGMANMNVEESTAALKDYMDLYGFFAKNTPIKDATKQDAMLEGLAEGLSKLNAELWKNKELHDETRMAQADQIMSQSLRGAGSLKQANANAAVQDRLLATLKDQSIFESTKLAIDEKRLEANRAITEEVLAQQQASELLARSAYTKMDTRFMKSGSYKKGKAGIDSALSELDSNSENLNAEQIAARRKEIMDAGAAAREEMIGADIEMGKQALSTGLSIAESLATQHLEQMQNIHAQEMSLLEEKENRAMKLAGTSELRKYMIESEFAQRKDKLRKQQEAEEKKALRRQQTAQLAQVGMNTASAIMQVWADSTLGSTPVKAIFSAAVAGLGATQAKAIAAPKLADGTPFKTVGGYDGDRADSIWAKLSPKEMVLSADKVASAGGPYGVEQAVENARRSRGGTPMVLKIDTFIGTKQFAMEVGDLINQNTFRNAF